MDDIHHDAPSTYTSARLAASKATSTSRSRSTTAWSPIGLDRRRDVPRLRDHPEGQGPAGRTRSSRRASAASAAAATSTRRAYALDTAWRTHVPQNATLVRNIAQACETLQSIPRYFYALFAIDLTNKNYAKSRMYDEAVRRFAPFVGTQLREGRGALGQAGGGLRDLRRAVAALELHDPRRRDVRADAFRRDPLHRDSRSLEGSGWRATWLGCSIDRWLENKTWDDVLAWVDENDSAAQQRLRLLYPLLPRHRSGQLRPGMRQLPRHRHLLPTGAVRKPHYRRPQRRTDQSRSGVYDGQ